LNPPGLFADLAALARSGDATPALCAFGREYTAEALLHRARRLAAGLQAHGLGDGRRIALALPNIVDVPLLALAGPLAGTRLEVLDPREEAAVLAERLNECRADAVATADIGQLFDRVRGAADAAGDTPASLPILVARMTEGLPFPRNLLLPLLRGAGLATVPAEARFLRLRDLSAEPGKAAVAPGDTRLEAIAAAVRPELPAEGSVLFARMTTTPEDLAAMLAVMAEGLTLVLAPRLDERGLANLVARHTPALAFVDGDTVSRLPAGIPVLPRREEI
jgi:acyl-CoA synthetase (AMP-forming)/AMP-acid ligase II